MTDIPAVPETAPVRKAPLRLGATLGYSAGQLIDSVINNTLLVFLLFYVTVVCGLPGALAGAALSVGLVVDAVMDPLIGSLSDSWRSRWGRRLPFMMAAIAPVAVTFVLIFALPKGWPPTLLALWLAALSIVMRVSMSVFLLPYQAVGAELSDDYAERSGIMAWRWGVGQVGAVLAVFLGFGVFLGGKNGLSNRAAYLPLAVTLAVIFTVGALISARMVGRNLGRLHAQAAPAGRLHTRLFRDLAEIARHRSFQILFIGALFFFIALGVFAALGLHANTFFWRLQASETQAVTLALFGGLLAGAPLAGPLLKLFEKRTVLMIGMAGLAAGQGLPAALRLLGLLPLAGGALVLFLSLINFVAGALMAAASIAFSSMMADAADEHEHLFGARREGLFFAGWSFASKAATGVGALISGLILQAIDFPTDLAAHGGTSAVLPARTVELLGFFYGPATAVLTLGAVMVNWFYRLDRKAHAAIILDLAGRRAAASSNSQGSLP